MAKQPEKSEASRKKIGEALAIIEALGVPVIPSTARRKERMAMALLALANLKADTPWRDAAAWEGPGSWSLGTKEIVDFWNRHYGDALSRGSYDYVKRQQLDFLVEAGVAMESAGDPTASRNSSQRRYAIAPQAADVLRTFGQLSWEEAVAAFRQLAGSLVDRMKCEIAQTKVQVTLSNGQSVALAPGSHNELQKAIVDDFLARFGMGAEVLYLADASNRTLYMDRRKLEELGFFELRDDLLPDVVAYDARRNWIYLIEAVHSSNPISYLRHQRLKRLTSGCKAPRIYVSVFKDRKTFCKWLPHIAWRTEVWLVEDPSHLIHFDGEKYHSPYDTD